MDANIKIESNKLLAVEGKEECHFFKALLKFERINNVQTIDIGGKDKFKYVFPNLYSMDGFEKVISIGFVRDAEDQGVDSAFKSICSILRKKNLPIPSGPKEVLTTNPKVGIFIMPDNETEGMLEDLCLQSIQQREINTCIDDYVSCIKSNVVNNAQLIKFNEGKCRVQTYLASCIPIERELGVAALNHHWNFSCSCFDDIKEFLQALFH